MGMGYDKSKFVFSETFNNASGKTSGSGFIGVLLGLAAILSIIVGNIGYLMQLPNTIEFLAKIIEIVFASAVLLGVRKLAGGYIAGKTGSNGIEDPLKPKVPEKPEKG